MDFMPPGVVTVVFEKRWENPALIAVLIDHLVQFEVSRYPKTLGFNGFW